MAWTEWRLLAKGDEWFDDSFDYDGPGCYELGTGYEDGSDIQSRFGALFAGDLSRDIVYVVSNKIGRILNAYVDAELFGYRNRGGIHWPWAVHGQRGLIAGPLYATSLPRLRDGKDRSDNRVEEEACYNKHRSTPFCSNIALSCETASPQKSPH